MNIQPEILRIIKLELGNSYPLDSKIKDIMHYSDFIEISMGCEKVFNIIVDDVSIDKLFDFGTIAEFIQYIINLYNK